MVVIRAAQGKCYSHKSDADDGKAVSQQEPRPTQIQSTMYAANSHAGHHNHASRHSETVNAENIGRAHSFNHFGTDLPRMPLGTFFSGAIVSSARLVTCMEHQDLSKKKSACAMIRIRNKGNQAFSPHQNQGMQSRPSQLHETFPQDRWETLA